MANEKKQIGDQNAIRRAAKAKQKHGVRKQVKESFSFADRRNDQKEWNNKKKEVKRLLSLVDRSGSYVIDNNQENLELLRIMKQWRPELRYEINYDSSYGGSIILGFKKRQVA